MSRLSSAEKIEKMKKEQLALILKMHGIEMTLSGCGCCSSPNFSFTYKGEEIFKKEESFDFSTSDYKDETT